MAAASTSDLRVLRTTSPHYVDSPIIRVVVGPAATELFVHEGLICPRSDFFRKVKNGNWKESEERKVSVPEDESEIVSLYLKLLYTNQLYVKDASPSDTNSADTHSTNVADEYATLSKVFVLAEKLMDDQAEEAVLDAMSARSVERSTDGDLHCPALDSIQIIYGGTCEGSPARKLLAGMYTQSTTCAFITEKPEAVPKDFLRDLAMSLLEDRSLDNDHISEVKKQNEVLQQELESLRREHSSKAREEKAYFSDFLFGEAQVTTRAVNHRTIWLAIGLAMVFGIVSFSNTSQIDQRF